MSQSPTLSFTQGKQQQSYLVVGTLSLHPEFSISAYLLPRGRVHSSVQTLAVVRTLFSISKCHCEYAGTTLSVCVGDAFFKITNLQRPVQPALFTFRQKGDFSNVKSAYRVSQVFALV